MRKDAQDARHSIHKYVCLSVRPLLYQLCGNLVLELNILIVKINQLN